MAIDAAEAVRVIRLAEAAGVPVAFLGDAGGSMARGSFRDIDLLVAEEDLGKLWRCLAETLGREGYVLFNAIANEYSFQLYWRHPDTRTVLHVDLLPRLTYRGLPYLHIPLEGASIDRSRGFPAVAAADLALYTMMRQVLWAGEVTRHGALVSEALGRQRDYMLLRLGAEVGRRLAAEALDIAGGGSGAAGGVARVAAGGASGGVAPGAKGPSRSVRRRFLFHAFARHPLSSIAKVARHYRMLARRFRDYPGLLVVLLGPDGSGKTSVIRRLSESPNAPMRVLHRHLFPGWLPLGGRPAAGGEAVENPHGAPPRTALSSALKLVAWYFEFTAGRAMKLWRPLERGELVLFDRYAYDILVDPVRYRYGGPAWLAGVFARAVPAPDLCIALDAPVEVLMGRKTEISREELGRQRKAYVELVGSMRNGRVVDAAQALDGVAADIQEIVLELLATRAEKRRAEIERSFSAFRPRRRAGVPDR